MPIANSAELMPRLRGQYWAYWLEVELDELHEGFAGIALRGSNDYRLLPALSSFSSLTV
jgi:hypothetical protein